VQAAYQPVAVEQSLTAALPGAPGWAFTGRVDALTQHGIVDFKTAGKPWPAGKEHGLPQASAYYWLYQQQQQPAQERRPGQCAFLVFTTAADTSSDDGYTCTVSRRVTRRDGPQVAMWLAMAAQTAQEIAQARTSGAFPATTGPLCGWCGVLGSCDAGRSWLAAHGRQAAVPVVR
jgi:hypothetical protein